MNYEFAWQKVEIVFFFRLISQRRLFTRVTSFLWAGFYFAAGKKNYVLNVLSHVTTRLFLGGCFVWRELATVSQCWKINIFTSGFSVLFICFSFLGLPVNREKLMTNCAHFEGIGLSGLKLFLMHATGIYYLLNKELAMGYERQFHFEKTYFSLSHIFLRLVNVNFLSAAFKKY